MLRVNKKEVDIQHFPVGEMLLKDIRVENHNIIEWFFDSNEELVALYFIVNHIRNITVSTNLSIHLFMYYIPYARQDRAPTNNDVLTLKYFCNMINDMNFNNVVVLDPHSPVSMLGLDRVEDVSYLRDNMIQDLFSDLKVDYLFYPDTGCQKRLSHLKRPKLTGFKERDFDTGEITDFYILEKTDIAGKDVLIVDDICSKGGTFYYSAKLLKENGARNIYLYVTHCENAVLDGEFPSLEDPEVKTNLLDSGYIKKIYTTDTICTIEHPLLEKMNVQQATKFIPIKKK